MLQEFKELSSGWAHDRPQIWVIHAGWVFNAFFSLVMIVNISKCPGKTGRPGNFKKHNKTQSALKI